MKAQQKEPKEDGRPPRTKPVLANTFARGITYIPYVWATTESTKDLTPRFTPLPHPKSFFHSHVKPRLAKKRTAKTFTFKAPKGLYGNPNSKRRKSAIAHENLASCFSAIQFHSAAEASITSSKLNCLVEETNAQNPEVVRKLERFRHIPFHSKFWRLRRYA